MMVGVPASGKTTYVEQEMKRLEEEHRTCCSISRDKIRFSMLQPGEDYFAHESEVFEEFIRQINEVIELGIEVIFIDATHLTPKSRWKVLRKLRIDSSINLGLDFFRINFKEILNRNSKRIGLERVPEEALENMYNNFIIPNEEEMLRYKKCGFGMIFTVPHIEEVI